MTEQLQPVPVPIRLPKGRTTGTVAEEPGWEEAPTGFGPYADFTKPGEFLEGTYHSCINDTGPNKRNFYRVIASAQHNTYGGKIVGAWGNQSLDAIMVSVKQGQGIRIYYLGGEATKRGQNPVKVYSVRVRKG